MNRLLKSAVLAALPPIARLHAQRDQFRRERDALETAVANHVQTLKRSLALQFIVGDGIEIGAFDKPLMVAPSARVRYVDKFSTEQFAEMYPDKARIPVDIVDNGETLGAIANASQDFVIGSHFFEHCQNPIGTLRNLFRVVRVGGVVFLVVPDKRFTFDKVRPTTPFSHLMLDDTEGPKSSQLAHCQEWSRTIDGLTGEAADAKAKFLVESNWPIHYHVWDERGILEVFTEAQKLKGFHFALKAFHADDTFEATVVMERTG